jgi:lysophospholipase L1-like esterase
MRKLSAVLLAALMVLALAAGTSPAQAKARPKVLVIGDSITSMYNDKTGDPMRGWWSFANDTFKAEIVRSARSGAGYLKYGDSCKAGRFGSYLDHVEKVKPKFIIVAGGSNDVYKCVKNARRAATKAEASAATKQYMQALRKRTDKLKIPAKNVYVFVPWGSEYQSSASAIKSSIHYYADKYGFQYVGMGMLPRVATFADEPGKMDAIHPNAVGSAYIARQLLANSNLDERIASS